MPRKELTTVIPEADANGSNQVEVTLQVRARRPKLNPDALTGPAAQSSEPRRIPRIARLMALAIKFQEMVDHGEVRDYADLARLGYVTRARFTQIMNLALLAPDLQEELLFATEAAGITEHFFRQIIALVDWDEQRERWKQLRTPAIRSR